MQKLSLKLNEAQLCKLFKCAAADAGKRHLSSASSVQLDAKINRARRHTVIMSRLFSLFILWSGRESSQKPRESRRTWRGADLICCSEVVITALHRSSGYSLEEVSQFKLHSQSKKTSTSTEKTVHILTQHTWITADFPVSVKLTVNENKTAANWCDLILLLVMENTAKSIISVIYRQLLGGLRADSSMPAS